MEVKRYEIIVVGMIITALSCFNLWIGKAEGQEKRYPNKPIGVIIGFPPGGTVDPGTRVITNELTKELGVPISIQYKPGAGGVIAASYVATAKADGYTILSCVGANIVGGPLMQDEPPYNPLKDFTPIASYAAVPNVLTTYTSSNFASFDDVIKFAKEKPGVLTCTTSGVGTQSHYVIEVLKIYGVDIIHVPAKGGSPAVVNILGKHVDLAVTLYATVLPQLKSGGLRILATTNKMAQEPKIPVMKDKGFPETEVLSAWQGFFAPPNLPKPILEQLANSFRKVIQMPSVVAGLEGLGFTVEYKGPDELKKKMAEELSVMEKIAKLTGFRK